MSFNDDTVVVDVEDDFDDYPDTITMLASGNTFIGMSLPQRPPARLPAVTFDESVHRAPSQSGEDDSDHLALLKARLVATQHAQELRSFQRAMDMMWASESHVEALEYMIMRLVAADMFSVFLVT